MTKALSLYELNSLVADVINTTMARSYWLKLNCLKLVRTVVTVIWN